ncbi:AEC family transporter [Pseudanabaena sp. FACHB-1998]|uniref:AEC family transporter n=1 Tax=Pseudanabaena sp. FACHB-1998 TaxID=2692858 RepID=UPI0016819A70|nr:AEC family transporter [Pseudanabaena sp. FACHB-1998]MBD2178193.1 AEC family transporter [Pseudanabaena sp. FACHB-1998]
MNDLFLFYATLIGFPTIGYILKTLFPIYFSNYTYQFAVWIATPTLVFTSYRNNILSDFWTIPFIAITAIVISTIFVYIIIDLGCINERIHLLSNTNKVNQNFNFITHTSPRLSSLITPKNSETQASLIINGVIGNTSYIAFPIILLVLDSTQTQYFTWGVIFSLFNSTLVSYFLLMISYRFHNEKLDFESLTTPIKSIFRNQIFWALLIGYLVNIFMPLDKLEGSINQVRYLIICINLIAIGAQLSFSKSKLNWNQSFTILLVKMLITPLVISALFLLLNITSFPTIIILLQVAMPPLLLSKEIYKQSNLSKNFNISAHSIGFVLLAFTVPIWAVLSR